MSPGELRRIVESGDEQGARRAVRACGERLRSGTEEERAALAAAVAPLSRHASAIVRLGVADVCDALPQSAFEETHALLLADFDRFVRASAEAAGHRRARARKQEAKTESDERVLAEILQELEARYDKGARRLAERAIERAVERFAVQLDHEVGKVDAPLHLAVGRLAAEVERPERSPGRVNEHAGALRERIAFVFSIVRGARQYASRPKPVFAEEKLADVVEEARAQLVGRLPERTKARLAFVAEVDRAMRAEVDRHALMQALQNVLQNGVEAYAEGAERLPIRVSAQVRSGGSQIELRVADDGVGIAETRRGELFVPFGSRKPGGTGVGLVVVRRMVEEVHGGTLDIESVPGRGTTVIMTLPAKQVGR